MTKSTKAERDARRIAEPVALVQRPLKYVQAMTRIPKVEGNNVTWHEAPAGKFCRLAARAGRGDLVQRLARRLSIELDRQAKKF